MAAAFFLFFAAKKLPKKPEFESFKPLSTSVGLAARAGVVLAGKGFPVLGSTWTGLVGLCRSFTIAIALGGASAIVTRRYMPRNSGGKGDHTLCPLMKSG